MKLAEIVKLLDSAGEELLANHALELAERVNLRIQPEARPFGGKAGRLPRPS
jgi:hypothetical protein